MQQSFKYVLILSMFITLSYTAMSQSDRSGEIGVLVGGSYYLGEISKVPFANTRLAASVLYRHNIDKRISLTGNFTYGSLTADDASSNNQYQIIRAKSFNSSFYELAVVGEFNFIPFISGKKKKHPYTPYVFAGLSEMYYPGGVSKFIFSIPFGMGMKYNINSEFIFGANIGMRKTFNDFIDFNYVSPSPERPEKQIGYVGNNDWYSVFGVSLTYKVKYRVKCPAFD